MAKQNDNKAQDTATENQTKLDGQDTASDLAARVEELEKQLEAVNHKRLQAMADLENFRRRVDEEKSKYGLMANRMMVDSILEVLDDVGMAQSDEGLDLDRAKNLLGAFTDKLLTTLRLNGVEKIEINKGDDFDSNIMEAITTIPGELDNKVVDVISGAYRYAGKDELLKTAKVVVSKAG